MNSIIHFCEFCNQPTGQKIVIVQDSKYREHELCMVCWEKIVKQVEKERLEKATSNRLKRHERRVNHTEQHRVYQKAHREKGRV
jgi:hypothetical protein